MIFRCMVGLRGGIVITCDGIEFDGKLWVVPGWLYHDTKAHAIPERMIRFDNQPYQKIDNGEVQYANIILPVAEGDLVKAQLPSELEHIDNALHVRIPADEFPRK